MASVSIGDGGANPPHGSTTTAAEARALVEPLILVVQILADRTAEQARHYQHLLALVATAGAGTLGRPGALDEIEAQAAKCDAGMRRLAELERARAGRAAELRAAMDARR